MPKREALLRLRETLRARCTDLDNKLATELASLRDFKAADSTGDSGDAAFDTSRDEMSSRLAELDDHELNQIERALARLTKRTYGVCEGNSENCQKRIPVARLHALPCTTFCVNCERELEEYADGLDRPCAGNWTRVFDWEAPTERGRITISEMEMELSHTRGGSRRHLEYNTYNTELSE